jgi:large subunit ribosomal protein L7/L12
MTSKISSIVQDLKSLTLLEASELVKEIEEVFGVDASTPSASALFTDQSASFSPAPAEEKEQTEFDVSLQAFPAAKKIAILKIVRSLTGLGLIEAKKLVESSPTVLRQSVSKEDADDIKKKIEDAGGTASIK